MIIRHNLDKSLMYFMGTHKGVTVEDCTTYYSSETSSFFKNHKNNSWIAPYETLVWVD